MAHAGGRPRGITLQELKDKIVIYKQYLQDNDKPPTFAGLAYFTGLDRKTIFNYRKDEELFPTIKEFISFILLNWEERGLDKSNVNLIFLMKNYGYTDKQEIELDGKMAVSFNGDDKLED